MTGRKGFALLSIKAIIAVVAAVVGITAFVKYRPNEACKVVRVGCNALPAAQSIIDSAGSTVPGGVRESLAVASNLCPALRRECAAGKVSLADTIEITQALWSVAEWVNQHHPRDLGRPAVDWESIAEDADKAHGKAVMAQAKELRRGVK